MVREQSIKLDFLPLKLTISGSKLRTVRVAKNGAAPWMRLHYAMYQIACVQIYYLVYTTEKGARRNEFHIHHLCCAQFQGFFMHWTLSMSQFWIIFFPWLTTALLFILPPSIFRDYKGKQSSGSCRLDAWQVENKWAYLLIFTPATLPHCGQASI